MILKIIAFELVAGNSLSSEENTCDMPSTCEKTVLRFQIWLKVIFSNWICLRLQENLGKIAAAQGFISVWDTLTRWLRKGLLKEELSSIQVTTFFGVSYD